MCTFINSNSYSYRILNQPTHSLNQITDLLHLYQLAIPFTIAATATNFCLHRGLPLIEALRVSKEEACIRQFTENHLIKIAHFALSLDQTTNTEWTFHAKKSF